MSENTLVEELKEEVKYLRKALEEVTDGMGIVNIPEEGDFDRTRFLYLCKAEEYLGETVIVNMFGEIIGCNKNEPNLFRYLQGKHSR